MIWPDTAVVEAEAPDLLQVGAEIDTAGVADIAVGGQGTVVGELDSAGGGHHTGAVASEARSVGGRLVPDVAVLVFVGTVVVDSLPERLPGESPDSGRTGDILAVGRGFDWPKDSLCRMYSPGDQGADCGILKTHVVQGFLSLLGKAVAFVLGVRQEGD